MFRREPENVFGSIYVAIMNRTAFATFPSSYSKLAYAFRPRDASAFRAALGTVPFIDLQIFAAVPNGFIRQHLPEGRPASIQNGLRHSGFRQLAGIDIAHNDTPESSGDARGLNMVVVLADVRDLGVDCAHAILVACTLGLRKLLFVLAEMARVLDFRTIGKRGQRFEAKIDADGSAVMPFATFDLTGQVHIPAATSILAKRAAQDFAAKITAIPVSVNPALVNNAIAGELHVSLDERKPAEGFLTSVARTFSYLFAGFGKLTADGRNRVAVKAKLCGTSGGKLNQIECGRPFTTPFECMFLGVDTVIPDKIAGSRMALKLRCAFIFDAIAICKYLFGSHGAVACVGGQGL
jgi:hypothetical protein